MAAELRAKFDALSQALTHSLQADGGAAGHTTLAGAARSLVLLARVAFAIQQIERTALGIRDTSGITQSGSNLAGSAEVGIRYRVEDLSTEERSALAKLAALSDRARHRSGHAPADGCDGPPLPPACPG
jgi:hypothetical protein